MTRTFFRTLAVTLVALGALIVLPSAAMADPVTVTMSLTSAGSLDDASHGVYISPYYATINGGPETTVICDDFNDDSYVPSSWTATVYDGSGVLTGTRMALLSGFAEPELNTAYDAVAYLALQLQGADATTRALISFAIWDIFLDTSVSNWLTTGTYQDSTFLGQVQALAAGARTNATDGQRSILTIYSPINIISGTSTMPQEFVSVSTPEASAPAILALNLMGLLGIVSFVRRRSVRNAGITS